MISERKRQMGAKHAKQGKGDREGCERGERAAGPS